MAVPGIDTTIVVRHPRQAELAEQLGAAHVVVDHHGDGARRAAIQQAGAGEHRTLVGGVALTGGFDTVYECAGSAASLDAALQVTAPRGRVALIGTVADVARIDLTLAWARELRITGSYVYGREASVPGQPHTIDHLLRLLSGDGAPNVDGLVTHRFRLADWRDALRMAMAGGRRGAVKVVFDHRMS
jgi:threonine dehydrogenase-like Zn-dependent dehydrogenase